MSMKILIMGLLKEHPRHPYEMKRTMIDQNWNRLFSVTDGNLYHNIRRAEEQGHICGVKTEKVEQRPNRTVYDLTEKGEEELARLILEVFQKQKMEVSHIYPALLFVRYADKQAVEEAARAWAAALDREVDPSRHEAPAFYILEHVKARREFDRKWLLSIADWLGNH